MKTLFILLITFFCIHAYAQPKIILDTDFGGDADDLGALAMLHHFVDKKECDLLAVMAWSTEKYAVSAIDAVNTFYGHPNIPIGTRKGDSNYIDWNYCKPIADNFKHQLNYNNVPDATVLYRKILSQSDDNSITIVVIGPLMNIQNLIQSQSDSISDLDGKELIRRKVKQFVIMGGQFPQGNKEWNFDGNMPGVTKFVIQNIEVPIVFSGFEVGVDIKTGEVFNAIDKNSPLYVGFMHFSQNAPWVKMNYKGKILDNSTYDQTAVLYAVRNGVGTYWNELHNGICIPDDVGGNTWTEKSAANHSYLILKMDKEELAKQIESFMLGEF
jgi:inosine-uridine nucleoside N-ribohydrolase